MREIKIVLIVFLIIPISGRRRISQSNRAFDDRREATRIDFGAVQTVKPVDELEDNLETTSETEKETTTTTTTTTTTEASSTEAESQDTKDDPVVNLLAGAMDVANLTKTIEAEYADDIDDDSNRTIVWINTCYKALDFNLTVETLPECVKWQNYWNISAQNETEQDMNETINALKDSEIIFKKKRLKEIGLDPDLLDVYKAVGLLYKEICGNHGRTLWYRTREDARRIGIDSESPICEPFKEELNPDEKALQKLALDLNFLIQNITEGYMNPWGKQTTNYTDASNSTDIQGNNTETSDTISLINEVQKQEVEQPQIIATISNPNDERLHYNYHENDRNREDLNNVEVIRREEYEKQTTQETVQATSPATAKEDLKHPMDNEQDTNYYSDDNDIIMEVPTHHPTSENDEDFSSEIQTYDDDIWDYKDMEKRFKVKHRKIFFEEDGNGIQKQIVLRFRRKRSADTDPADIDSISSSESDDDWINVKQVIKTEEDGTKIVESESEDKLIFSNNSWIEIDASDPINPILLIAKEEAIEALGLAIDTAAFQRFENVGLYLPGICSEYVPKHIDEFNSSSFEGVEIDGPIGVNITALELAGVNLTALAEKLRNDTEVDEILSRTNESVKNLGGSFILPVLNKNQYDPFSAPIVFQGSAVVVRFGIYIESMSNFQTTTMDYDMDIYLMMSWRDARLVNPYDKPILVKEEDILEKIWRPDPFFANAKEAEFHEVTFLNFLMRIFPDGLVLYETRVKIKPSCNLILCKYPHDRQTCDLLIKSFAYPIETVRFEWFTSRKDAIDKNPDVKLPELYIDRYDTTTCPNSRKSGSFSCLRAVFRLKRDVGYHIAQTYIPTSLALMFSWVGVWLPEEFMEGRIGVAITVLLTLSTESAGAREHLPSVSYLKAIDLWFGFITGFVFFTLLQTLFVIGFDKRANQLRKWAGKKTADITEEMREALLHKATKYHKTGRHLDNFCRVFYPLSFILFLFMYYFVFTEGRQDDCMNRR